MPSERELHRISLMIGEDQYRTLTEKGLNLSWLVRDLLDQYLNEKRITLEAGEETRELYQKIIASSGGLGADFEPFFREALHAFLKHRIETMMKLEKSAFKKPGGRS